MFEWLVFASRLEKVQGFRRFDCFDNSRCKPEATYGSVHQSALADSKIAAAGFLSMRNMEPRRISQAPPLGGHTQTADFAWDDSMNLKRDDTSSEQQQSFM
jgi:hypothetical protein